MDFHAHAHFKWRQAMSDFLLHSMDQSAQSCCPQISGSFTCLIQPYYGQNGLDSSQTYLLSQAFDGLRTCGSKEPLQCFAKSPNKSMTVLTVWTNSWPRMKATKYYDTPPIPTGAGCLSIKTKFANFSPSCSAGGTLS